jgi:hypothetical protein
MDDLTAAYEKYAGLTQFATSLVGPSEAPDVVSIVILRCITRRRWHAIENQRAYLFTN